MIFFFLLFSLIAVGNSTLLLAQERGTRKRKWSELEFSFCPMGKSPVNGPRRHSIIVLYTLFLLFFSPSVLSKSPRPITENEIRQKKNECYADIESGLWGQQCKSSMTAKENCALRCLSPTCYELIYESDPLEEGEKDLVRGQEYKYCMYKLSIGETLEGIKGAFE